MAQSPTNTAPGSAGQNGALDEKWELVTADDGHMFIATAGDIVCHQDPNHVAGDEWDRRNFRLLVAAPQMLEALRGAVEWMSCVNPTLRDGKPFQLNLATYKAAIAAATGEAV